MRTTRSLIVATVCGLVALAVMLPVNAALAQPNAALNANRHIYQPNFKPFGMTYGEWGAAWWQWAMSIPDKVNPILDPDGSQCAVAQQGPVWFLAGSGGTLPSPVVRKCTIPAGKAIFIPIVNIFNDYPCPDPAFQPAVGQSIESFLAEGAKKIIDAVDLLEADLDDEPVTDLDKYRGASRMVQFTGAANLNQVFDACITGSPQLGVSDGFWLMVKPFSVAREHTLRIKGGISTFPFVTEVTYHLTIVNR